MKIKENFVLQEVADDFIVVPVGKEADRFHGVFNLNETGAFLWKYLSEKECDADILVNFLVESFSVNFMVAQNDVKIFIQKLQDFGCLEG